MKDLGSNFREILKKHRGLTMMMILVLIASMILLLVTLFNLHPSSAVVKIGYGDIGSYQGGDFSEMQSAGGYRDGNWTAMLMFVVLALVTGVMHNFIAIKLYKRRGAGTAVAFLGITFGLVVAAFIVLFRLLGEG